MADSANVLLHNQLKKPEEERDFSMVFDRLNRIASGARKIIMKLPKDNISRCDHKRPDNSKCHLPLNDDLDCIEHGYKGSHQLGSWF